MGFISDTARKIVFWNYSRTSWQWDVLCVLILAFIFLSPKTWFVNGERQRLSGHHSESIATVILSPESVGNETDKAQLEHKIRTLTGRVDAQIIEVRQKRDEAGKTLRYEVDIR